MDSDEIKIKPMDEAPTPPEEGSIPTKDSNSFRVENEVKPKDKPPKDDGKIDIEQSMLKEEVGTEIEITEDLEKYVDYFQEVIEYENRSVQLPLHVDELASKVAKLYEGVRRVIDWKEEHLLRRTAMERILKRSLISEISGIHIIADLDPNQLAEPLILELIRGGYFHNDSIPKDKIFEVQSLLKKYIFVLKNNPLARGVTKLDIKRRVEFYNWILSIAACELEELLDPPLRQSGLMNFMTTSIYRSIKIDPSENISKEDLYLQTYIAVHRTLFNLDDPFVSYNVLRYRYPDLFEKPEEFIPQFTEDTVKIWDKIKEDLESELGKELFRVCERYDVVYRIIGDVANNSQKDPENLKKKIANPVTLMRLATEAYDARIKTLKGRLFKSAIFSTLSIFLAGSVSLFIVEVPIAKWVHGKFSTTALIVDIMIPTILMFILVAMIRPPKKTNLQKVLDEVKKLVFKDQEKNIYEITLKKKTGWFIKFIFILVYLAGGLGSLYLIYLVFDIANVPWTSLYIDTANIAIVVASAMLIRARSKELTIEEEGGFGEFLMDFFSIPLAKIGKWLSEKWKEWNFVSVFFTALIDAPISTFIAIIEDWRAFIKERKSEIH